MAEELRILYADEARADLRGIEAYIAQDDPIAAARVMVAVEAAVTFLSRYPRKSRRTQKRGVRAVALSTYPYIIFFKIRCGELEVVRVLHGAQRRPGFREQAPELIFGAGPR